MHDQGSKSVLLVDPKEAANMLAVSPRKLWGLTFEDQRGLPYVRLGRLVRYRVDELDRWTVAQQQGGCHDSH